jgi:hypothetical protein
MVSSRQSGGVLMSARDGWEREWEGERDGWEREWEGEREWD